jgi:PBP1b-binding outer membrane lipoprotein LpoB
MKKLITLLAAATLLFASCTAEDVTPVQNITPVEQVTDSIYKIVDTNLSNMKISRLRDSVWTSDPQWVTDMKVPVRVKDVVLLSSNGEISTAEKELFIKIECTVDNPAGFYTTAISLVGDELNVSDVIGKPW